MRLKSLLIQAFTPIVWKYNKKRMVSALNEFSQIEFDSGRQILNCLNKIESPKLKSYLLQHVLEEYFHADLFADLAKSESDAYGYTQILKKRELLTNDAVQKQVVDCFAYIHVGEKNVNADFKSYSKINTSDKVRAVFRKAGEDEDTHEKDTDAILKDMIRDYRMNLYLTLFKAKCRHLWYSYSQAMSSIGKIPLFVLLNLIYFLFGWIGKTQATSRLNMGKLEQLQIFRDEISDFESQFRK